MPEKKVLNIALIGPGLIGGTLLKQILQQKEILENRYGIILNLIGLSNSKKQIVDENGINISSWKETIELSKETASLENFIEKLKSLSCLNKIFVDCTASEALTPFYSKILEAKISLVAANKKANSDSNEIYTGIRNAAKTSGVKFLYETNVGAALPVIETLQTLIKTGDRIIKIQGILSGTLSFLFNTYTSDQKWSDLVKDAESKGYTEPDPRDDLNGMDVARKILILARECGANLELDDIEVENLVPESARSGSTENFYNELKKYDEKFAKKVKEAENAGEKYRYIASYENGKVKVSLEPVNENHPFYNLNGSDNIISFWSERYKECPLVIKGPGAGAEVTAAGVFGNILKCNQ